MTKQSSMENTPGLNIEIDLPPEYLHYQDEGCELDASCLNCHLPLCVYDEPGGKQRWLKKQRDREIVRLFEQGRNVKELAEMFGLSRRTVQRALKTSNLPYYKEEEETPHE